MPLTQQESAAAGANPYIRKYTADLTAAGFTLLGEARHRPATIGEIQFRVFAMPDGTSFMAVIFQITALLDPGKKYDCWPAMVSFMCHTFLAGGGCVVSMNWLRHGFRRKRTGPECQARVFPGEFDPIEFARRHAAEAARFAAETGCQYLRHARFEEYIRLHESLAEDERRHYADHPTPGATTCAGTCNPRREYRSDRVGPETILLSLRHPRPVLA